MATIMTILIRVISLLGKRNKLTREVFWWLVAGREHLMIFSHQKSTKCTLGGGVVMMCGAWQHGEVMWREEVMFRSLTERMEVDKKVSFQTSGQTTL
jgi:hypothetical protein